MTNSKPKPKAVSSKSRSRQKLLSSSRPPSTNPTAKSLSNSRLSSKTTRTLIRTHHVLQKQLSRALVNNDVDNVRQLERRIEENGGLEMYQAASTTGQGKERGGDTSWVLVEWLREGGNLSSRTGSRAMQTVKELNHSSVPVSDDNDQSRPRKDGKSPKSPQPIRILEIGALSPHNHLSLSSTKVRRIDLRSNHPSIEAVDFMLLDPEEHWEGDQGYDVLSLSLVLNFVGDAKGRGAMLARTTRFFRDSGRVQTDVDRLEGEEREEDAEDGSEELLPALFLVLPLPCVDNSRYLSEEHLASIMESLGYVKVRVKRSGKLFYSLWRLIVPYSYEVGTKTGVGEEGNVRAMAGLKEGTRRGGKVFKKDELRSGKDRNNFCIILDSQVGWEDDVG